MARPPEMTAFLAASASALKSACRGAAARAAGAVIDRWERECGVVQGVGHGRQPACAWVELALAGVGPERADLAQAFRRIESRLAWKRRGTAGQAEEAFWNGHANAVILGPGGLEARDDLWVGVTVLAPGVRYVDHDHPPEEVYLSLTPGEWWNAGMDWTDPGPRGAIYNPPGIAHAMRSGTGPLLALWYLPL